MEVLGRGAIACATAIQKGEILPSELLEACIERIQNEAGSTNAFVSSTFARARTLAAAADEHVPDAQTRHTKPLLGVPFVVSESLAMEGAVHSSGSRFRSNRIAGDDATAVQRLVEAGAIPIGVANTSELGFWIETDNLVYGRTSSPYDPKRIAGGASGGVGALVAAGFVPFGIGVDMVGSLRVTSHCCGVFSHKPTGGAVPVTGLEPVPDGRMRRYTSIGPISRQIEDLPLLYEIIRGPDQRDPTALPIAPDARAQWDPMWKRVIVCENFHVPMIQSDPEVIRSIRHTADLLAEQGAVVEYWRAKELEHAFWIWLALLHEGYGLSWNFRDLIVPGRRSGWWRELFRSPLGGARLSFPVAAMAITELITKESFLRIQRLSAEGRRLRERLSFLLADDAILLVPALPRRAPKHRRTLIDPQMIAYTALFNVLELPVTTVPTLHPKSKLPVGIQVIAKQGGDAVAMAAAARIAAFDVPLPIPGRRRSRFSFRG